MVTEPTAAPTLFDRELLRDRLRRAQTLGPAAFLLDRVAEDMAERLTAVLRNFADVAEVGVCRRSGRGRACRTVRSIRAN